MARRAGPHFFWWSGYSSHHCCSIGAIAAEMTSIACTFGVRFGRWPTKVRAIVPFEVGSKRRNIALNKTVIPSSVAGDSWQDFSTIVDGNLTRDAADCKCCAAIVYSTTNPWVMVDLGQYYWIDGVTLYGRTDELDIGPASYYDLEMHFIQHSEITENTTAAYTVTGSGFVNFVYVTFDDQINARYLTLYHHKGLRYIGICEVEIYGTDCRYGYYGPSCSQSCGHCYNGEPCDDITGECGNCAAGYRGTQCHALCTDGFYGSNCVNVCGRCFNGEPCDKIDGTCVRCDPGYKGKLCDTECSPRTYGQNCSEVCGFCHEDVNCNHVTGRFVDGCIAGRRGSLCKQECDTKSFGENCLYTCHCNEGVSCDAVTGTCEDGACTEGFSGLGCQQTLTEKENSNSQSNNPISLPVSIGVGVFLICIIVGLVVYVVYLKRRITRAETPNAVSNGTDTRHYDDLQY